MNTKHHGHSKSGTPLTDELIESLADEAEAGYDVEEILGRRGKRGRPALGSGPSTVESVRLDPELRERLARRAEQDGVPVSEVIREALRNHLDAAS
jgi:predicted HicB family RNase H-like nuclease